MRALPLILIALVIASSAYGQREIDESSGPSLSDRLYFGGGLSFSGGNSGYGRYTYFSLNPLVGYMVTPHFSTGLGVQWQHYNYPDTKLTLDQYGISPFVRYNFGQLFAYSEFSVINTPFLNNDNRAYYNRFLVGLGYSQPLGRRGSINAMGLYDIIYKPYGPFSSPWIFRVYFSF
ncbi:MAG TPA: hypothetical protein VFE57_01045 [Cyclobacteriaceae bacterium]|jgi:hypothetical protein|nr:hypothetical protein [Cyclobacteriaceae bacterium]